MTADANKPSLVRRPGYLQATPRVPPGPSRQLLLPVMSAASGLGFFLFLLVNATLFVRPGEVIPDFKGESIFLYLIIPCLLVSVPDVLRQLSGSSLEQRPMTVCVLGLFVVGSLHLAFLPNETLDFCRDYGKTVVYYMLLVALVDTPSRLRTLIFCTLVGGAVAVMLSVLDFHKVIKLEKLEPEFGHPMYGIEINRDRLEGSGLFQDPNELCVLIASCVPLCFYTLTEKRAGILRLFCPLMLVLFAYALLLTQSRGGLIALVLGMGALIRLRYGWGKTIALGLLGVPVLLLAVGGRQTSIAGAETAHSRIELWSNALEFFRSSPLFGIGPNQHSAKSEYVAHNSYIHAFAELGFFGGLLFLGLVYFPVASMYRIQADETPGRPVAIGSSPHYEILDPDLRRLHPYLFGSLIAFASGMLSLSMCYIMPTYALLGLSTVFVAMATTRPPTPVARFDLMLLVRLSIIGVLYLAAIYLFVRVSR